MTLGTAVLDLLFPPKCPFCHRVLDDPRAPVCPACQPALPWLEGAAGEQKVEFADGCFSPLAYRDSVVEAVHRYKFQRVRAYDKPLGQLMAQCLLDRRPQGADLVTWAPLSRRRLRERGFDQAELLARVVARETGIPARATLCKRRNTGPQSRLQEESARRANALGAYEPVPGLELAGMRVVLVDDVVTSGATLGECARILRQAGAAEVVCLTLTRAHPGGPGTGDGRKIVGKNG